MSEFCSLKKTIFKLHGMKISLKQLCLHKMWLVRWAGFGLKKVLMSDEKLHSAFPSIMHRRMKLQCMLVETGYTRAALQFCAYTLSAIYELPRRILGHKVPFTARFPCAARYGTSMATHLSSFLTMRSFQACNIHSEAWRIFGIAFNSLNYHIRAKSRIAGSKIFCSWVLSSPIILVKSIRCRTIPGRKEFTNFFSILFPVHHDAYPEMIPSFFDSETVLFTVQYCHKTFLFS